MLYAIAENGAKIMPTYSGQRAICPGCHNEVGARCGHINVWHWGHLSGIDCDSWAEPLSVWHLRWQAYLASLGAEIEVNIERDGISHRADARMKDGLVIELQHSALSVDEIVERERFYQKMIWVFDVRSAYEKERFLIRTKDRYSSFRWKHAKKSIAYTTKPVRLDLGGGEIFRLKKIYPDAPCGGYGHWAYIPELHEQETKYA